MTSPLSLSTGLVAPDPAAVSDPVPDPAMFGAALLAALQPAALASGGPVATPVALLDPSPATETGDESAPPDASPPATAGPDDADASVTSNPVRTTTPLTLGALLVPAANEAGESAAMHRSPQRTKAPHVPSDAAPAPSLPTGGAPGPLRRSVPAEGATARGEPATVKLTPPVVESGVTARVAAATLTLTPSAGTATSTPDAPEGNARFEASVFAGAEAVVAVVSANETMPAGTLGVAAPQRAEVTAQSGSPTPSAPIPASIGTKPRNETNVANAVLSAAPPAGSRQAASLLTAPLPVNASIDGKPGASARETAKGEVHAGAIARPRRERSDTPAAHPIREQAGTGLVPATPQTPDAPARPAEQHSTPDRDQAPDTKPQAPSASITDQAVTVGAALATGMTVTSAAAASVTSVPQNEDGRSVWLGPAGQQPSDAAAGDEHTTTMRMDGVGQRDDARDTTPRGSLASAFAHALAELLGDAEIVGVKLSRGRPEPRVGGSDRAATSASRAATVLTPAPVTTAVPAPWNGEETAVDPAAPPHSARLRGQETPATSQPMADAEGDTVTLASGAAASRRVSPAAVTLPHLTPMPLPLPASVEQRTVEPEPKLPTDRQEIPRESAALNNDTAASAPESGTSGDTPSDAHTNSSATLGGNVERRGDTMTHSRDATPGEARNLPGRDQRRESPAGLADRVTLQFTDADGRPTRIRVAVLGEQIRAVILPPDRETGRQLERRMDDLHAALVRQGFVDPRVSVQQSVTSEAAAGWVSPGRTDVPVPRGAEPPADDQRQGSGRREQQQHGEQQRHPQGRSRNRDPEPREKDGES